MKARELLISGEYPQRLCLSAIRNEPPTRQSLNINHTPNILSAAEKEQLAKPLTDNYVSKRLPAFYVQVHFIEDAPGCAFISGEIYPKVAEHHNAPPCASVQE